MLRGSRFLGGELVQVIRPVLAQNQQVILHILHAVQNIGVLVGNGGGTVGGRDLEGFALLGVSRQGKRC